MSCGAHAEMLAAFPYPPYDIQQQLMINIYEALQNKQIGLFESPTGTGKTLSVICSTLKWLEDEREAQAQQAAACGSDEGTNLPDWMRSFSSDNTTVQASQQATHPTARQRPHKTKQARQQHKQLQSQILNDDGQDLAEFLVAAGEVAGSPSGSKRTAEQSAYVSSSSSEDGDSETEAAAAAATPRRPQIIFCSRTHSQLSQFVGELHRTRFADSIMIVAVGSRKNLCINDEVLQLHELAHINERCLELQRNKASSSSNSRKAAAINPKTADDVTDRSRGIVGFMRQQQQQQQRKRNSCGPKPSKQRKNQNKKAGCPFLAVDGGAAGWEEFSDLLLAAPIDVEELAKLGRKRKVCPYYGSRRAVPLADVILAPYSSVLLPDARDSLGIQLAGSVVVFDEAHNLLDAINGAHSTAVSAWQLLSVQRSFSAYYERFKAFLNPGNAQNLQLLLRIAAALHNCLSQQQQQQLVGQHTSSSSSSRLGGRAASGSVVAVNDLLFDNGLEHVNMLQLATWVKDTKLAYKVSGYTAVAVEQAGGKIELQQTNQAAAAAADPGLAYSGQHGYQALHGSTTAAQQQQQQHHLGPLSARDGVSAIHSFISFLCALTNSDADGRVIIEPAAAAAAGEASSSSDPAAAAAAGRGGRLRYVLLNSAGHFGRLLSEALSVLLVSGTLAPVSGLQSQLFPHTPPDRLRHFACGHVLPASQLLAVSIGAGPAGKPLNLRRESRGDQGSIAELGQLLLNLSAVVPGGCVVFAPSFGYMELLATSWQASGLMAKLQQRKHVFREPRSATEVEQVLAAYAAAIAGSSSSSSTTGQQQTQAAAAAVDGGSHQPSSSVSGSSSSGCGAVLLCVVGGKLSEGINFGDALGRCVVMLGMPYPNPSDPELRERMAYMDKQAAVAAASDAQDKPACHQQQHEKEQQEKGQKPLQLPHHHHQQQQQHASMQRRCVFQVLNAGPPVATRSTAANEMIRREPAIQLAREPGSTAAAPPPTTAATEGGKSSSGSSSHTNGAQQQWHGTQRGRDYYDDLCFKAVNQCIGRVVRHKDDYAAIVLVDSRWVVSPAEWATTKQQQQQGSNSMGSGRQLPVQKLPGWVQRSYVATNGEFGTAFKELAQFFKLQQELAVKQCTAAE